MILSSEPLLARFAGMSAHAIAAQLGSDRRTVVRWRGGGGIGSHDADRLAVAAGVHPFELWPELADAAVAGVEATCRCGDTFVPRRKGHVHCSERCRRQSVRPRERALQRERYRTDPAVRAKKLAQVREYRERSKRALTVARQAKYRREGDELRAKRRERYAANAEKEKARQARYRERIRTEREGAA